MNIVTNSVIETINFAKKLSRHLKNGDILALTGELGSGKTVFAKGIIDGLGIKKEKVISPSFVLMQQYNARIPVYHFDLYRIKDLRELHLIGYEDYLEGNGVSLIEWADKAKQLLPKEYLAVKINIKPNKSRQVTLIPYGERYRNLAKELL